VRDVILETMQAERAEIAWGLPVIGYRDLIHEAQVLFQVAVPNAPVPAANYEGG